MAWKQEEINAGEGGGGQAYWRNTENGDISYTQPQEMVTVDKSAAPVSDYAGLMEFAPELKQEMNAEGNYTWVASGPTTVDVPGIGQVNFQTSESNGFSVPYYTEPGTGTHYALQQAADGSIAKVEKQDERTTIGSVVSDAAPGFAIVLGVGALAGAFAAGGAASAAGGNVAGYGAGADYLAAGVSAPATAEVAAGGIVDQIGSDWAAGEATGNAGGLLQTTPEGLTAANMEAASGVAGSVNSGIVDSAFTTGSTLADKALLDAGKGVIKGAIVGDTPAANKPETPVPKPNEVGDLSFSDVLLGYRPAPMLPGWNK